MKRFMRSSGIVTFVTFAIVLATTEMAVRNASANLPVDPGKWIRIEIAQKLDRLDREISRGEDFDVVFAGSSVVAASIDPVAFEKTSGLTAYNAAWAGATARTTSLWIADVVEPLASPRSVLVGIQSAETNDNSPKGQRTFRKFRSSPGYRQTTSEISSTFGGWLERLSSFLKYRLVFRTPTSVFGKDKKALEEVEVRKQVGVHGRRVEEPRDYWFTESFRRNMRDRNLVDISFGGAEYRALVRLHDELESRGEELILMATSVTDDYYEIHEDPVADRLAFRAMLHRFHRETGATVIDAADAFPSSAPFRDPIHLDAEGAVALSRALGRAWGKIEGSGGWFEVRCNGAREPHCRISRSTG